MADKERPSYPNGCGQYVTGALGGKFAEEITERMLREQDEATGYKFHRVYDKKKIRPNKDFIKFLNETEMDYANFSFLDATGVDSTHPIVRKMNKLGLIIIPHNDLLNGQFGYLIADSDQLTKDRPRDTKNISLHLYSSFYHGSTAKGYKGAEEFQAAYVDAVSKNFLILRSDCSKERSVGFVVVKGDGPICHHIKRPDLLPLWTAPTDKQRQRKLQEEFPKPANDDERQVDEMIGKIFEDSKGHYAGILRHNVLGEEYVVPVPTHKRFRSQIHKDCRYAITWTDIKNTRSQPKVDELFLTAKDIIKLAESKQWVELNDFNPDEYKLNRLRQRHKDADK